jgi:hypothetical protein
MHGIEYWFRSSCLAALIMQKMCEICLAVNEHRYHGLAFEMINV